MRRYLLERVYLATETLGSIWDEDKKLICKTMELPDRGNARSISCIPEGLYIVNQQPPIEKDDPNTPLDESGGRKPRPYWHFRFQNVPKRIGILIHKITFVKDLQGCIGVGSRFADLNSDKVPDMEGSTVKLQWMVDNMPSKFELEIRKRPE